MCAGALTRQAAPATLSRQCGRGEGPNLFSPPPLSIPATPLYRTRFAVGDVPGFAAGSPCRTTNCNHPAPDAKIR